MNDATEEDAGWTEAADEVRARVERFEDGAWREVRFRDCKLGDLVRFYSPEMEPIHPSTREPIAEGAHVTAILEADAFKNLLGTGWQDPVCVNEGEGLQ